MEDIKSIIAENIVQLRRANGMTQIDLAEKLNYSDKAVSKWERGESVPDISVLKNIADLFGVTVDFLITADHDPSELEVGEDIELQRKKKESHLYLQQRIFFRNFCPKEKVIRALLLQMKVL